VVIENRPGGDGLVAINAFVSANDDHTLLWVPVGTFAVHPYGRDTMPTTRTAIFCNFERTTLLLRFRLPRR